MLLLLNPCLEEITLCSRVRLLLSANLQGSSAKFRSLVIQFQPQLFKLFIKVRKYRPYYKSEVGDFVLVDEILAILETEKTTVELRAENSGQIVKYFLEASSEINIDADFVEIDTSIKGGETKKIEKPQVKSEPTQETAKPKSEVKTQIKPEVVKPASTQNSIPVVEAGASSNYTFGRSEKVVPMSKMRQTIAKRLKQSQNENATLTTFNEVDMGEIINLRNKYQKDFTEKHGVKLGFMSFFLKASTIALQENPAVNSVIQENNIVSRNYIDISVAVASPTGLLVPVIRDCSSKGFADFEQTLAELSEKARNGKIAAEDMQGGTFTISNGGVYGSMFGTPIINPPQSAILGMHNTVNRPVVRNGQIVARPIMYLALSYDHRLVDGREAVLFLKRIRDLIESPEKLIFDI